MAGAINQTRFCIGNRQLLCSHTDFVVGIVCNSNYSTRKFRRPACVLSPSILSVYKKRGAFLYPYTCARVVGAAPTVTPSRTGEVSQGKTKAQDNKSNAKAKTTKSRGTKQVPPARPLPGQPQQPWQDPCRDSSPRTNRAGHP